MRRTLACLAALSLAVSAAPAFGGAGPPYKLDVKGKCHDSKGGFAKTEMCKATPAAKVQCKDAKGKFAKCGAPGAKTVK